MQATANLVAPVVGVGAVIWRDEHLLLVQRTRPPRAGQWSLPGGRQELGETVQEAARREIIEETGLRVGALFLVDVIDLIERDGDGILTHHFTLIDFTARALEGEAKAGSDAGAVGWFHHADLSRLGLWSRTLSVIDQAARRRQDC